MDSDFWSYLSPPPLSRCHPPLQHFFFKVLHPQYNTLTGHDRNGGNSSSTQYATPSFHTPVKWKDLGDKDVLMRTKRHLSNPSFDGLTGSKSHLYGTNPTLSEWTETEKKKKMQYIADFAFPKQHVEDNTEARRKAEEERLLTHLYYTHNDRLKSRATANKTGPKKNEPSCMRSIWGMLSRMLIAEMSTTRSTKLWIGSLSTNRDSYSTQKI